MSPGQNSRLSIDRVLGREALRQSSVNGVIITFTSQITRFAFNFGFQIALARLLAPTDFGIVAMATPFLAFAGLFTDLGLTQAVVQRPAITQDEVSFIFWTNVLLGLTIAALFALSAPFVATFYKEPRVTGVVLALAGYMAVGGLYSQHLALLSRRFEFGKLAIIDLVSAPAGWGLALLVAGLGGGYWAILINQGASTVAAMLLTFVLFPWRPNRPRWLESPGAILGFGGNVTLGNLANLIASNLDNVLIGRFAGDHALGLYDRAYKLLLLPATQIAQPITRVATPLLSRTNDDVAAYRRAFARMLDVSSLLTAPAVVFAVVLGQELIAAALGPRWFAVAPLFQLLGIAALTTPYSSAMGWLLISQNRSGELRNWAWARAASLAFGFIIGVHWGAVGVSIAYVLVSVVLVPGSLVAVCRRGPLDFAFLGRTIAQQVLGLLCLTAVEIAVGVSPLSSWWRLGIGAAVSYPVYTAAVALIPSGRASLQDLILQARRTLLNQTGRRSVPSGTTSG